MIDYTDEIIAASDKVDSRWREINTQASPEDLYKVGKDCEKLITDKAKMLQNIVARTLYTHNWKIPNTCTAVALFKSRVRENKKDDWDKLFHLIK